MTNDAPDKPGIHELLVAAALNDELRRRLVESPEEAFRDFELSDEEKEVLRHPDERLLPYLGAALARQSGSAAKSARQPMEAAGQPHAVIPAATLPDTTLVLTLVPCVQADGISYAVWVNSLPPGTDPSTLPPPVGTTLPGQPLAPLHAVVQVTAVQVQDSDGNVQIGLSAALRQSTNLMAPPSPPASLDSSPVQSAVAAVRAAAPSERYGRLIDLIGALRGGGAR